MIDIPLKLIGFAVGMELFAIALILSFRAKYLDGVDYPDKIPFGFFLAGTIVILTLSEVTVASAPDSFRATLALYYAIGGLSFLAFVYYWIFWDGCDRS